MELIVRNLDGTEVDYEKVCEEEWASELMYCDIDGWAITEYGNLILMDECGNYAYAPPNRFKVEVLINVNS